MILFVFLLIRYHFLVVFAASKSQCCSWFCFNVLWMVFVQFSIRTRPKFAPAPLWAKIYPVFCNRIVYSGTITLWIFFMVFLVCVNLLPISLNVFTSIIHSGIFFQISIAFKPAVLCLFNSHLRPAEFWAGTFWVLCFLVNSFIFFIPVPVTSDISCFLPSILDDAFVFFIFFSIVFQYLSLVSFFAANKILYEFMLFRYQDLSLSRFSLNMQTWIFLCWYFLSWTFFFLNRWGQIWIKFNSILIFFILASFPSLLFCVC